MSLILAKSFNTECIGKIVKNSKQRLKWIVLIDGIENVIVLNLSYLSRKYEIFINGISNKAGSEMIGSFIYSFKIMNCNFEIESSFTTTTLKINGKPFEKFKSDNSFIRRQTTPTSSSKMQNRNYSPTGNNGYYHNVQNSNNLYPDNSSQGMRRNYSANLPQYRHTSFQNNNNGYYQNSRFNETPQNNGLYPNPMASNLNQNPSYSSL